MCSPAYDVKCYILTNKDGSQIDTMAPVQFLHLCNLIGGIPGINLISSSYRLGTSLIDVISSIYMRYKAAYHFAHGNQETREETLSKLPVTEIKLNNGATNFGRSMVELSYIFIMATTLMVKLSRASSHAPIIISHQLLSNFSKKYSWICCIPLILFVYDWAMRKFYHQRMKVDLDFKKSTLFTDINQKESCLLVYENGCLIKQCQINSIATIAILQGAMAKGDISTLDSIISQNSKPNAS